MGESSKRVRQRSRESATHGKASQVLEVKRPKLATDVPVQVTQQPTPQSPTGWSSMKDFLMTELRREMGLPLHRPQCQDNVDEKSVNLACPLFIRDPASFTHVRNSCTDGNIKGGIGKLIEHIKRVHLRTDKQCHNCGARFSSKPAESKSSHSRSCSKIWSPHEPPLLSEAQHRVLDALSVRASGQSLDYKYRYKLLMKLYPGQEEWAKKVEIYHDAYSPCLLPAQLMFDAMERAVDRWERGYNTHYDSDGSDADSDKSREYRRLSRSSPSASSSTDASSAYPPTSSGGYSRTLGTGGGGYTSQHAYQTSDYQDQSWGMDNMSLTTTATATTDSTQHAAPADLAMRKVRGGAGGRPPAAAVDGDYAGIMQHHHHLPADYQGYAHSGTLDDFDDLASSSYMDPFEPVFDVVSTVPSDYHSYTLDADHAFSVDYPATQGGGGGCGGGIGGHYAKDTINPKDIHNTLVGMGPPAAMPRYLVVENEEDSAIVLHDTQEYLGFAGQQTRRTHR
ncbi:hypothetical protein CTA2_5610 [Colletotrichum tanaceti]|uniref:Uncharacterized protein n=1 Tax=Colletotrichum tanaceti TaxID=1306861 RepID=A0A4U6X7R3_9PEZI|nr:hypothetical protein CTA2_5610 [Colletotrichum tanaceti]TKW50969.1 hypothetical protein CTA1_4578 [Colletotrichum tanaceti]